MPFFLERSGSSLFFLQVNAVYALSDLPTLFSTLIVRKAIQPKMFSLLNALAATQTKVWTMTSGQYPVAVVQEGTEEAIDEELDPLDRLARTHGGSSRWSNNKNQKTWRLLWHIRMLSSAICSVMQCLNIMLRISLTPATLLEERKHWCCKAKLSLRWKLKIFSLHPRATLSCWKLNCFGWRLR